MELIMTSLIYSNFYYTEHTRTNLIYIITKYIHRSDHSLDIVCVMFETSLPREFFSHYVTQMFTKKIIKGLKQWTKWILFPFLSDHLDYMIVAIGVTPGGLIKRSVRRLDKIASRRTCLSWTVFYRISV